jgi:adiponectin receptor
MKYEEVPEWLRYPYITHGYRHGGTYVTCLKSLYTFVHNETFNAWSMITSLFMGTIFFVYYATRLKGAHVIPYLSMFIAQWAHHPFSIGFHTFMPVSLDTYILWRTRDMSTIFVLNVFTTIALCWYTWPWWGTLLSCLHSFVVAKYGIGLVHKLKHQPRQINRRRITLAVATSALGYYIPVICEGIKSAHMGQYNTPTFIGAVGMVICHSIGGLCYVMHFPQRIMPGTFDLLGSSHNIMHVLLFVIYNYGYIYLWFLTHRKTT